jgi:membrane-bound lytic murein transglycosylase A
MTVFASSASTAPSSVGDAALEPAPFRDLAGWASDDHAAAFAAFRLGCAAPPPLRRSAPAPEALAGACQAALSGDAARDPRGFFERWFQPLAIRRPAGRGFLTGYFEPELPGSLVRSADYPVPLHGRPADLVTLAEGEARPAALAALQGARRLPGGGLAPFPTRRAIDEGALGPDAPVIAWMRDEVDRFVMQVQGSGRLRLPDGSGLRIAYAGRNGHPYVSLGRLMSQRLAIPPAEMTMDRLVARLKADAGANRDWIWENPSYVFFRIATELAVDQGPIGGAGHPLTPHRSIAADRALWPYNLPIWLSGDLPTATRGSLAPLARLMIVQDTGSAIVGPARFDYFHGSGDAAGFVAGLTRQAVDAVVLWPRSEPVDGKRP